jgi:hypothetical protein
MRRLLQAPVELRRSMGSLARRAYLADRDTFHGNIAELFSPGGPLQVAAGAPS